MQNVNKVEKILRAGGVILYPTEGVYGLGCDPFNETAVRRLVKIKHRKLDKGLILITANWRQVQNLVKIDLKKCSIIKKTNNPITWAFPTTKNVPRWVSGKHNTIAIRVTSHSIAKKICQKFGGPIVSTSANLAGQRPITKLNQVDQKIIAAVDLVVYGPVGKLGKPTKICDIKTGKTLRT